LLSRVLSGSACLADVIATLGYEATEEAHFGATPLNAGSNRSSGQRLKSERIASFSFFLGGEPAKALHFSAIFWPSASYDFPQKNPEFCIGSRYGLASGAKC
jgi:hypothetical protein